MLRFTLKSIRIRREFDLVETPCLQIVGRYPELINAFAEMMTEPLLRRHFKEQEMRLRPLPLMALHIDGGCEHAIRRRDEKALF